MNHLYTLENKLKTFIRFLVETMKGLRKIKHQHNANDTTHAESWISSSMFSKNIKYFEKLSYIYTRKKLKTFIRFFWWKL